MKSKTVQEKMAELNELVAWFDSEEFVLEQAIEKFKQAEKLATELREELEKMKNDIQIVSRKFDQDSQ